MSQLIERAQKVIGAEERLRGLWRAHHTIIGDLTLPVVLRRIVEAARELVGAGYAALGVIGPDGQLAEFVHHGMSEATVRKIGHLPRGKGLLGALIEHPEPIRLRRMGDDPRSVGLPAGHPPMASFLGVPIRVRDEVFGNLYLADSREGEFTVVDEELSKALAATAGLAIENARLYETARRRQVWLEASTAITQRLLSPNSQDAAGSLRFIAQQTHRIAEVDLVTVALPVIGAAGGPEREELRVAVAVGDGAERLRDIRLPRAGSLAGRVFDTGEPLRLFSPTDYPELTPPPFGGLEIGPMLVIPLRGSRTVLGVLTAARWRERPGFHAADLDMAAGFANQAAVALELAEGRAEQQRGEMLRERDRIAADLHDQVIQRLFAAGLSLRSVADEVPPGRASDRILTATADLDAAVKQIRNTIFQLHRPDETTVWIRDLARTITTELTAVLGFEPCLRFLGSSDRRVPGDLADDLAAVLREALSNVARHARASAAEVTVTLSPDQLIVDVSDNGVSIPVSTTRRSGLANLRQRAARHGGSCAINRRSPSGTRLTWSVPLR